MSNLSQEKRERMLNFLETIKKEKKDDEWLIAINEIENELNSKKYGLVWEKHEEAVDLKMKTHVPVFYEVKERELKDSSDERYNFILEGDNLHSLKLLEKTHKEKIDLIYIDPPYNTGNKDFIYDDKILDSEDNFKHSKWLSFMSERLSVAKNLLKEKGVIFISIDDREVYDLKLLCDEIFNENCFVANIIWQKNYSPHNNIVGIPAMTEYLLVYSKTEKWEPAYLPRTESMDKLYKNPDNDDNMWTSGDPCAPGAISHQGMVYAIQHPFTGEYIYPSMSNCWRMEQSKLLEIMCEWAPYKLVDLHDEEKRAAICNISASEVRKEVKAIVLDCSEEDAKKLAQKRYEEGKWPIFYFTNKGKGGMRRKRYLDTTKGRMATSLWLHEEVGHTDEAKKEIKNIFNGKIPFDTPKPTRLIKRILQLVSNKDAVVLDFFAGSGTTGQAVLEQNIEDGGKRHFILCTNNENLICEEITYPRLKTVITGSRADGSKYSDGLPCNMKYFKTDYIDKSKEDDYYSVEEELTKHIKEMIELERGISIDNDQYLLVLSDDEMDLLEKSPQKIKNCKAVYLSGEVLLTQKQEALLNGIETIIIPKYYFEDELMEVGEL